MNPDMRSDIKAIIKSHQDCITDILKDKFLLDQLEATIELIVHCLDSDKKIMFCGNGGSAADSEHLAAEFSGKFKLDRAPLNAQALHVNASELTAISNDYSYKKVFARILESRGHEGDILIALTTSGQSKNIINVIKKAKDLGIKVILITGQLEKAVKVKTDLHLRIPSKETARIQEGYMLLGHILCEAVEYKLFGNG